MSRLVIAVGFFFAQANSAIYCSVTGLFLAQYYKKEMSFGKIVRTRSVHIFTDGAFSGFKYH